MPTAAEITPRRSGSSRVVDSLAIGSVRFERRPLVEARTGLPCSSLYEQVSRGLMPPPVRIGSRSVAWISAEIDALIGARARGAGDDEIRALVTSLVKGRRASTSVEGAHHA